ncbi:hypothetical protein PT974_03349 [Cladobotryum mycophilum]|uniref:Wings apart-like protein C-terminal domain-containing protein n=1 Tax=Cladobotryum mycophilum TaxID=491253 RepID=A0ABR0SS14_9HYPO
MPQKNNNKSILSYFQPAATRAPSTPRRSSSQASPFPSHKSTPAPKRAVEIGASDDEDGGFSDGSFEDLNALLSRERPASVIPARNPYATPRAKRAAVTFQASPLAIISRHKFDLKALAKDARRDDATNASSMRVQAAAEAAREESPTRQEKSLGFVIEDIVKEKSGQDAHKVLRAVQRAEPAMTQARYCFFDRDYRVPPSSPTPKQDKSSPWQLLTRGNSVNRERDLASGGLPDNIFHWILEELCIQKSCLIRQEYCHIVASCPDQVERLLTPGRLGELFIRLGATDDLQHLESELTISKPSHEPYQERDWSCVESFLVLLGMISRHLSVASAIYATQVLLRMAMDKMLICNIDLLSVFEDTVTYLTSAIPQSSWDAFCHDTCSLIHSNVKQLFIKVNALLCISIRDPRSHDLRRRLAITFLFDDPKVGRYHPEEVITIRGMIQRLTEDDFNITPDTDFAELKAGIFLLDIAIDDGSATVFEDAEDEKEFNQDVDELAARLREIWRKINDSGMKLARTETKSIVEWVQQRLANSVRTRRKAKKSIFDMSAQEEDASIPRQQEMMKKFFQKAPKTDTAGENAVVVKT